MNNWRGGGGAETSFTFPTFVIYYYFSKQMSLININEYAYQIIFLQDYKMKGVVQIVYLTIKTRNNDAFKS